jgi:hypothetical protein
MVITERPEDVQGKMVRLYKERLDGQVFIPVGFESDAESALSVIFDLDYHRDPKKHVVIIADDISHLWQGARELLDIVVETKSEESEDWFVNLLCGSYSHEH